MLAHPYYFSRRGRSGAWLLDGAELVGVAEAVEAELGLRHHVTVRGDELVVSFDRGLTAQEKGRLTGVVTALQAAG